MTKKDMTELFSMLMLAWPNAEMFKGGVQKLGSTIELWTVCLQDVDFWTGQQAVVRLCRECKFPPTIAEFKQKSDEITTEVNGRVNMAWNEIRWAMNSGKSPEAVFNALPNGSFAKQAISVMGGPAALLVASTCMYADGRTEPVKHYNYSGFCAAANKVARCKPALGGDGRLAIPMEVSG